MNKYPVNIAWSEEDDCYIAYCVDLPGCTAHGETSEEALRQWFSASEGFLAMLAADGIRVPKPSSFQVIATKLVEQIQENAAALAKDTMEGILPKLVKQIEENLVEQQRRQQREEPAHSSLGMESYHIRGNRQSIGVLNPRRPVGA